MEKNKESRANKIKLEEVLYFFFWGILFAMKGVGLDEGHWLFSLGVGMALCCFAAKMCMTGYSLKEWVIIAALLVLAGAIWINSGEKAALAAALIIIGMKNISIRRLFKISLAIWSITFALSTACGILHIRDGVVVVHQKLGLGPIIRWSMGYTHPNVLHVSYFVLAVLILYVFHLHGRKLMLLTAALMIGNLFIFLFSISYTGIILVTGYLIINLYLDQRKRLTRIEKILLQCIMPFCVIFPLAGPFVFSGRVFGFFNRLLSTRFELVYNIFRSNPIQMFGTKMVTGPNSHVTLDSSFAYMLMKYGVVAFVLILTGYFLLIRQYIKKDQRRELAIMLAISVAGITEQFLFNLSFKNLSLFFLGELLFELIKGNRNHDEKRNREIALLPWGNTGISLPDCSIWWGKIREAVKKRKRGICMGTVLGGILAAILCAVFVEKPECVYVNRELTEYRNEEEELFLKENPDNSQNIVIGYQGADVGMYCFTGNIVSLENIRNLAGYTLLGMEVMLVLMAGTLTLKESFKKVDEK